MPWFNFKPVELRDPTKCCGCLHFEEVLDAYDWQICKAMPKSKNRVYYAGMDEECRHYTVGERDMRPEWCPLEPV